MFNLIKQPKYTLPVIPFDVEPIKQQLQEALAQYDGMVFTEDEMKPLKLTITELNKAEKMLEDYRKDTKKAVSAPIVEFENKMKELKIMIVQTRSEFKDAYDTIETNRREAKTQVVLDLMVKLLFESDLQPPFAELVMKKEYLTKTMSLVKVKEDLEKEVGIRKQQQDLRSANIRTINDKCKISSYEFKLQNELDSDTFVQYLDYKDVDEIIELITQAAERQLIKETPVEVVVVPEPEPQPQPVEPEPVPDVTEEILLDVFEVEGTEHQLTQVENFMNDLGVQWKRVD